MLFLKVSSASFVVEAILKNRLLNVKSLRGGTAKGAGSEPPWGFPRSAMGFGERCAELRPAGLSPEVFLPALGVAVSLRFSRNCHFSALLSDLPFPCLIVPPGPSFAPRPPLAALPPCPAGAARTQRGSAPRRGAAEARRNSGKEKEKKGEKGKNQNNPTAHSGEEQEAALKGHQRSGDPG